ncbi:MAG: hypothetical protein IT577_04565 [Verrucomicrobiae bacterium]|nr:hypothetical protein [Verrucomicrobiae bacterium]
MRDPRAKSLDMLRGPVTMRPQPPICRDHVRTHRADGACDFGSSQCFAKIFRQIASGSPGAYRQRPHA